MIALPIPIIWKIPRERRQKIAILFAFLVAGGGTLASCIRLYSIKIFTESRQPMRDAAPISTWSFIEINLGILCASSAAIKPIFSKTRAPSLEKEGARRLRSAAGPRGTIGTPMTKVRTTISRDLKDYGRWSQSQASTAVTSPNTIASQTSERDLELGKGFDTSVERCSSRLSEPPRGHQKIPRGRQGQLLEAPPQRLDQPTVHSMASPEPSSDPKRLYIDRTQMKLSQAFPEYFPSRSPSPRSPSPSLRGGSGGRRGQAIAGW